MISTIRFLRTNRYRREIGSTDSVMGYGIHDALVRRGIAEFVTEKSPEPVPDVEPETEPARERKQRRSFSKES